MCQRLAKAASPKTPAVLLALLCWTLPVYGDDLGPGLEKGDALLKKLPEIEPGFTSVMHFEAVQGDKTIGYGQLTVEARKLEAGLGYAYTHVAVMKPPNGMTIKGTLDAVLDRHFCPLQVSAERRILQPDGQTLTTKETVVLGSDELVLTKAAGGKEKSQKRPRPGGALVFGIDFLLQRLDLSGNPSFVLRELDFQEGRAVHQLVRATAQSDGTIQAEVAMEGNQMLKQVFVLNARQELVSFNEPPLPVVSKRVDRDRFEEVQKMLGSPL